MKKILLFATLMISLLFLCSCDNDNNDANNPDYQRGYDAGLEDGRNQSSQVCDNNAQNQEDVTAKINYLMPILAKYFASYNSPIEGNIQLITDSINACSGNQAAIRRLANYEAGLALQFDLGELKAKQACYRQRGSVFASEFEKQNFPGLAHYFSWTIPMAANNLAPQIIQNDLNNMQLTA